MTPENTTQPPNAQPPTPPATPDNKPDDKEPAWLPDRLDRARKEGAKAAKEEARKAILAEMGIDDPDTIKKIVAEQKKRDDERKTVEQKLAEESAARKKYETDLAQYVEATKTLAGEQLATLSEEQRSAVLALAGDDPARQIKTIAALRPTWKQQALAATDQTTTTSGGNSAGSSQQQPAPAKAPPPKPADTAPPAGAPSPAGSVVTNNHLAVYEALQKSAPFSAPVYYLEHRAAIDAAKQARGG